MLADLAAAIMVRNVMAEEVRGDCVRVCPACVIGYASLCARYTGLDSASGLVCDDPPHVRGHRGRDAIR